MDNSGNFRVYSSSAGSGKTFTLTREYLLLILINPSAFFYKKILAVTFTNDAANEMKKRVLEALKSFSEIDLVDENHKDFTLLNQIKAETMISEEMIEERSRKIYKVIMQEYSDFAIRTIDSFTNQIVSSFSEELDLPFNFEIEMNLTSILNEATDELIDKIGDEDEKELTQTLVDFSENQIEDGQAIDRISEKISKAGFDLYNDQFFQEINKNKNLTLQDYRVLNDQINTYLKQIDAIFEEIIQLANLVIDEKKLVKTDFSKNGNLYDFFKLSEENINYLFSIEAFKSPQKKVVENGEIANKKSPNAGTVLSIADELINYFISLETIKNKVGEKYIVLDLIRQKILNSGLIGELQKTVKSNLDAKNLVTIGDFNRRILEIILAEPVPFIYERIGEKFEHLLIDEFQDTSNLQFFNLMPLIENSIAKGNLNLIVGDAKQSIYRWRGGNISLIIHLFRKETEILAEKFNLNDNQIEQLSSISLQISPQNLQQNFRSKSEIIDFNNRFFEFVIDKNKESFPFFEQAYQSYFQEKSPFTKNGGGVQVSFLDQSELDENVMNMIVNSVQNAISKGYQANEIAILLRKNKDTAAIITRLKEAGIDVASKESLLLKNSPVVNFLIAFLQVIQSPENVLFKHELVLIFETNIYEGTLSLAQKKEFNELIISFDNEGFFELFSKYGFYLNWFDLLKMGLIDLIELILQKFNLYEFTNELDFIFEICDFVSKFSNSKSNHIQDFLDKWEEKKEKLSISSQSEANAVTIMTTHGSKGLEFPIVILPFVNWSLQKNARNSFWVSLEETDFEELKTEEFKKLGAANLAFSKNLDDTILSKKYNEENEAEFLEGLNIAYVAFTRAKTHLHIICSKNKKGAYGQIGKEIEDFIKKDREVSTTSGGKFEYGHYQDFDGIRTEQILKTGFEIEEIISSNLENKLRLRRTSDKLFDDSNVDEKKEWGMKIHAAFERIETREDVEEAINRVLFSGLIQENEVEKLRKNILQVIDNNKLNSLFNSSVKVINERDILQKGKEIIRPDRVVLLNDEVYIIDYKTGEERDYYETQIKQYGQKYKQMGYKNINLLLVYLAEVPKIIKVA